MDNELYVKALAFANEKHAGQTRKDGDYSIARNGWIADYNDPISFLDMWISTSGNNDVQFGKGENANVAIYNLDLTPYGYDTKVENGTWAARSGMLMTKLLEEMKEMRVMEGTVTLKSSVKEAQRRGLESLADAIADELLH